MTKEQAKKLLEVIDAKIATHRAQEDWDGGLHETIYEDKLVEEFLELCDDAEDEED